MRLAIPCEQGQVCEQFSQAESFVFVDADLATGQIRSASTTPIPCGRRAQLPQWLADQGADVVLSVGMPSQVIEKLSQRGVDVVIGVMLRDPRKAIEDYLGSMLCAGVHLPVPSAVGQV